MTRYVLSVLTAGLLAWPLSAMFEVHADPPPDFVNIGFDTPTPEGEAKFRKMQVDQTLERLKNTGTWLSNSSVIVVFPKSGAGLAAYSCRKGEWGKVLFDKPLDTGAYAATIVDSGLGESVAAVQTADSIYAFSADAAKWGRLKLPAGAKATPIVNADIVEVLDGNCFYVFGPDATWSGINLDNGELLTISE